MVQSNLDPTAWIVESGVAYSTLSAAHTAASAKDTILLSEGIFTGITITKELRLVGQGVGRTIVTGPLRPQSNSSFILEHLTVKSTGSNIGLYLDEVVNVYLKDVVCEAVSAQAIYVEGCTALELEKVRTLFGTNGIYIDDQGTPELLGVHFRDVKIVGSTSDGLRINKLNDEDSRLFFEKLCIQGCNGHALSVSDVTFQRLKLFLRDSIFNNCVVSGKAGLDIDGCDYVEAYNCDIFQNDIGVHFGTTAPNLYKIEGNRIHDNNTTNVDNDTGSPLTLLYNWWGNTPPPSAWAGTIVYEPWLESPYPPVHNAIEMDYLLRMEIGESVTDGTNTTSVFKTDLSSATVDYYRNTMIKFINGNNIGQPRRITAYNQSTKFITVSEAFDTIPVNGEQFIIISLVAGAGSALSEASIADAVWDELLTGALHNQGSSAGKRLRQISESIIREGTAQSGSTSSTIKLDSGASSQNDFYKHSYILIWGGTGAGQERLIHAYDGTTKVADINEDWLVTPDNTSDFIINKYGLTHAHEVDELGTQAKADVNAEADQALVDYDPPTYTELIATEAAIRGADSDDLKDISDQLDAVEPEAEIHIEVPQLIVPEASNQLDGELAAGATALTMDDVSLFTESGFIQIENEKCYYAAKSGKTLTGLIRDMFSSGDVIHVDDTPVYQCIPHRITITTHDAGVPIDANSIPDISITNMKGDTKLASTAMTKVGGETGMYLYNLIIKSGEAVPDNWEFLFETEILSGKLNKYNKVATITNKAASVGDVTGGLPLSSYRVCTQDGYYDSTGTFIVWTDDQKGYVRDDNGNRINEALIVFYNKVAGVPEYQKNPPTQQETDSLGNWSLHAPAGTYEVHIFKSGLRNERVERTVT